MRGHPGNRGEVFEGAIRKNSAPAPADPQPHPKEHSELLSTVIAEYCEEQDRGGNWSARTKYEVEACLNLLQEVVSNVPVDSVDYRTMRGYKQTLMQIPAKKEKNPKRLSQNSFKPHQQKRLAVTMMLYSGI